VRTLDSTFSESDSPFVPPSIEGGRITAMDNTTIAKTRWWLLPIVLFYLVISILILAELGPTAFVKIPIIDAETYHIWAIHISRGQLAPHEPFFLSPLYPFLLGILYIIAGPHPIAVMIIQMLLGIGILWGIYELGARWFQPAVGILAALLLAIFGPFYYFADTLLSATLILFFNTLLLWLLWKYREVKRDWKWIAVGIIGGLSALARPNVFIFLVLLIIPFLIWYKKAGWRKWGMVLVGAGVLLVPVVIRNCVVGKDFTLTTTTAGINIYIGNHTKSTGSYTEAPFLMSANASNEAEGYRLEAEKRTGKTLTAAGASRYWLGETIKEVFRKPGQFIGLTLRKIFLFFHRVEAPTNISYYGAKAYSKLLNSFVFDMGLLVPLAMAGIAISLRRAKEYLLLYVYIFSYLIASLVFFVASEYRFPVVGVLAIFGAFFLWNIFRLFQERKMGWLALGIIVYFVTLGLSNHQTEFTRELASSRMDYFNLGSTLVKWGNSEDAIIQFQKALAEDPGFQEAHVQLGYCYIDIGETKMAEEEFRRAGVPMPVDTMTSLRDSLLTLSRQQADNKEFEAALRTMEELFKIWSSPPFWIYQEAADLYRINRDEENAKKYERLAQKGKDINY
jgi:4-amino-4-deoxy-L-arabinose transferase-like glycosyltransferase